MRISDVDWTRFRLNFLGAQQRLEIDLATPAQLDRIAKAVRMANGAT